MMFYMLLLCCKSKPLVHGAFHYLDPHLRFNPFQSTKQSMCQPLSSPIIVENYECWKCEWHTLKPRPIGTTGVHLMYKFQVYLCLPLEPYFSGTNDH
jgi:hypothetical protein